MSETGDAMADEELEEATESETAQEDGQGGVTIPLGYLPVGSVVMLEGGEKPVVIAGVMVKDAVSGHAWDYMGYPYPEGRQDASKDYFFDGETIENVLQLGFLDRISIGFQVWLALNEEEYRDRRGQAEAK